MSPSIPLGCTSISGSDIGKVTRHPQGSIRRARFRKGGFETRPYMARDTTRGDKPRRLIARTSAHTFVARMLARLLGYPCFPDGEFPFAVVSKGPSLLVSSRCFRMV